MLMIIPWVIVIVLTVALIFKGSIVPFWLWLKRVLERTSKHIYSALAKMLLAISRTLTSWGNSTVPSQYSALAALETADEDGLYDGVILEGLQNPSIKNIAITGPYGSGKSSILVTFQKNHPEYQYLNISLASFKEYTGKGDGIGNDTAIEYSILQQIFYHVRHQAIPFSRFKRIKNLKKGSLALRSVVLVIWAIFTGFLLYGAKMPFPATWKTYINAHIEGFQAVAILYVTAGTVYFLFLLLRIYNNSKFNRLNLTSGEIEIKPDPTSSALNVHLDELIYFFEVTKFNVVIVEDLDRFENPEVFTKLREISAIINNSLQVKRKVSFLFALRDDVFYDEKRTKFFDLIVPVIPVIDTNNSGEKIREFITSMGYINNEIPETFISDISLYVDDMRLLLNIMNEFRLYAKKLGDFEINYAELLAIIIYKNKYPRNFAELHERKGPAFELLNSKGDFLIALTANLTQRKADIEAKLDVIKSTQLRDSAELRSVYLQRLLNDMPEFNSYVQIANNNYQFSQLKEDDTWNSVVIPASNFSFHSRQNGRQSVGYGFKELEKRVDPNESFVQRLDKVNIRAGYDSEALRKELNTVNNDIVVLSKKSLKDLIDMQPVRDIKPKLVEHGMLVYLVSSGYLNEYYHYYLSHFYEGSLTKPDMDFFFAVKERRSLSWDFELAQTQELVKRLGLNAFERVEILNNSMLDYLLNNQKAHSQELAAIIKRITDESEGSRGFIDQYVRVGKSVAPLFKLLVPKWFRMWAWVDLDSNFPEEQKRKYFGHMFQNATVTDIGKLNIDDLVVNYLEKMPDFVSWASLQGNIAKVKKLIHELHPAFVTLNEADSGSEIFEYIYQEDCYDLSYKNIELMIKAKGELPESDYGKISTQNLTVIRLSKADNLKEYIDALLSEYLESVLFELPDNTQESEETIRYVLNAKIRLELKEQFLQKQSSKLSDLSGYDSELLELILSLSKAEATWSNVTQAYQNAEGLSAALIGFLSLPENFTELTKHKIDTDENHDEAVAKEIMKTIMISPDLPLKAIDALLKSAGYYVSEVELDGLLPEHVAVILENEMLSYTSDFYETIKSRFPNQLIKYLEYRKKDFMEALPDLSLAPFELRDLLLSAEFSEAEREKFYEKLSVESIMGPVIANQLAKLLLKRENRWPLTLEILFPILSSGTDDELKKALALKYFDIVPHSEMPNLLLRLDEPFRKLTNYKEKKFATTDINTALLSKLRDAKLYVSTFNVKGDKIKVNTKQKPK